MTCMNLGIKCQHKLEKFNIIPNSVSQEVCQGVQSTQSTEHTVCTELSRTVYNQVHNV